jgi:hypothetical protein
MINRRKFIRTTSLVTAGSLVALSFDGHASSASLPEPGVTTWEGPGGDVLSSTDYLLTLKQGREHWKPFVYYSYNRSVDKVVDPEGRYLKHGFLNLHANQYIDPQLNKDTYAHSWAYFDFSGAPVEVTLKISKGVEGIDLPLKSCGIFPQHLGIKCRIIADDTIRFLMDKPAKIAIIPNHLQAVEKIIQSGQAGVHEGYRNPFFLFAREPETEIPDREALDTLVVKPGDQYGPQDFMKAKTIWFEPGVHDYSKYNSGDPDHYIDLITGQTLYLAGGSYVYGHVSSKIKIPVGNMPVMKGRGTMSGEKNAWSGIPYVTTEVRNVRLEGIHLTDPNNHISHSNSPFKDVAVVGAWHGNTDGQTVDGPDGDPFTGWHSDNCFVMAADTNLKFRGSSRIRNYTVWQLANAEPLWIANSWDSLLDGLHVICYNKIVAESSKNPGQVINIHIRESGNFRNIKTMNVHCEAPFVTKLFLVESANKSDAVSYDNIVFENITVNTPKILFKSTVGNKSNDCAPFGEVIFRNLVINGRKVTNGNCLEYFALLEGVTVGKEVKFE